MSIAREGWEWFSGEPHKLPKPVRFRPPQQATVFLPKGTASLAPAGERRLALATAGDLKVASSRRGSEMPLRKENLRIIVVLEPA